MLKVIIVDDEPLARKGLSLRLAEFDNIEIVGECKNGLEAVTLIPQVRPDLVFLDIQMPGLNGFQVINKLQELNQPIPLIVFVTAFDSYAIKAFDVHALDYVLKPVDGRRLKDAVDKVVLTLERQQQDGDNQKLARLVADFTGDDCEDILRKLASGERISTNPYPDVLAIKDGIIPPTANLDEPDPELDLDYVPNKARKKNLNVVLSNSFAFGGNNICLLLSKNADHY